MWLWFVGPRAVHVRARWYPQDRRAATGILIARTSEDAAALRRDVLSAKAAWAARLTISRTPQHVG